jgi:hypothetical protein
MLLRESFGRGPAGSFWMIGIIHDMIGQAVAIEALAAIVVDFLKNLWQGSRVVYDGSHSFALFWHGRSGLPSRLTSATTMHRCSRHLAQC